LIHTHHHSQDLRTIGNLRQQIPLTIATLLSANIALSGLPFIAGFFSKDLIIEIALFNPTNTIIITIFLTATILTAIYSLRITITALAPSNIGLPRQITSDKDINTTTPIIILATGAIIGGALIN